MSAAPDALAPAGLHVESAGAGSPLVLLHGWGLHGGVFATLVSALARRHRVHVVDLPGHGHSPAIAPFTLDSVAAAVAHALATTDTPVTVLGWSFGATVALRWALAAPERVARLVLVGATPKFVADAQWAPAMSAVTLARFGDELRIAYRATLQRFLALQVHGSEEGRATLAALRHTLFARGEPSPAALAAALDILAATDLRADVGSIGADTIVIGGDRDTLTPDAAGAWLAAAMPSARHVVIPGAAHAPFLSHRAAFDVALDGFLDAR